MFLEINLRFGWEGLPMSRRSEQLAAYVRQTLDGKPMSDEAMLKRNKILDNGFLALKESLKDEFEKQIGELKSEPGCGSSLYYSFSDKVWKVMRLDDHDCALSVKFDNDKRMVSFSAEKPFKFTYFVEVKLTGGETGYYYDIGKKKSDLSSGGVDVASMIVEKSLYALFDVEN
jgi:hypothetical protein